MEDEADELPALQVRDWVAVVAHDLRDPMNAIVGMTDLLLQTPLDPEQQGYAETVQDAAAAMLTLINDLLDISRLERGELRFVHQSFDLTASVRRVLDWLRPRIGARDLRLVAEFAPNVPRWVSGDPGRLRQVLGNLVGNALKFTAQGEVRIDVTRRPDGDGVRFVVSDTGRGMDEVGLRHAGRPFAQLAATDRAEGVGLGLTITRHLVAGMGGRLSLRSAVGHGTDVIVDLPLPATASPPARPLRSPAGRRVMVIGGHAARSAVLTGRLEALGLGVDRVHDPADVVPRLQQTAPPPDALLVLCDALDTDVAAALAQWRQAVQSNPLPALALLATGVRGEAETARLAGFDGYLPETVEADRLEEALARMWTPAGSLPADADAFVTVHRLEDKPTAPWRLLVVDDNPMNVRLLQLVLERGGHRVETAADGPAAIARAAAGGLDAILMDIQMPGMSGLEATAAIRRLQGDAAAVPIIAVTANALPDVVERSRAIGMDGFLSKPIDPAQVRSSIADAVAARAAAGEGTG